MRCVRVVTLVVVTLGCAEPVGSGRPYQSVDPHWVTEQVAAELDASTGLFVRLWPDSSILAFSHAAELADGYIALINSPTSVGNTKAVAEGDRGAPIAWTQLRVCWRPTMVQSPWERPPDIVPADVRRFYSSHWSVSLCGADGRAQVAVGVADAPAAGLISVDPLVWPLTDSLSGRFNVTGIPSRFAQGLPLPPEQAVEFLFHAVGRPIATVPAAYNPVDEDFVGQFPPCGAWRMRVDSAVAARVHPSGALRSSTEFFVRRDPGCFSPTIAIFIAAAEQPSERWVYFRTNTSGPLDSVALPLRGPVRFERVTSVEP